MIDSTFASVTSASNTSRYVAQKRSKFMQPIAWKILILCYYCMRCRYFYEVID